MVLTSLQIKIGIAALASSAILLAMSASYYSGHSQGVKTGEKNISVLWLKDQKEQAQKLLALQEEIKQKEFGHRQESARISDQLRKSETEHDQSLAALNADLAQRLRISTERAVVYQRQAEAGSDQCRGLASHAAQLDRSLEEGRGLVGELAATLRQRDEQLRLIGAQLTNDRLLLDK